MCKFGHGDIVGLFDSGGSQQKQSDVKIDGIVYRVTQTEIIVAFMVLKDFEQLKQPVSLVLLQNEITYQRCRKALEFLRGRERQRNRRLVDVLFQQSPPVLI
jgi:hypothetical protein